MAEKMANFVIQLHVVASAEFGEEDALVILEENSRRQVY
jgi:hypothetical protein